MDKIIELTLKGREKKKLEYLGEWGILMSSDNPDDYRNATIKAKVNALKRQKKRDRRRRKRDYWRQEWEKKDKIQKRRWGIEDIIQKGLIYDPGMFDTPSPDIYIDWPLIPKKTTTETFYDYPEDDATIVRTMRHYEHLRRLRNPVV